MREYCQRCLSERVALIIVTPRAACVSIRSDVSVTEIPEVMGITDPNTGQLVFELCLDCGQTQATWPCPATPLDSKEERRPNAFKRYVRSRKARRRRAFGVA